MQLFVPNWPIMWELSISRLKFWNSKKNLLFLVKNEIYTQIVFFWFFLTNMILIDFWSLNL